MADIHRAQRIAVLDDVLHVSDFDGVISWEQLERVTAHSRDGSRRWVLRVTAWLREHGVRFAGVFDGSTSRIEFDYRALFAFVRARIDAALEVLACRDLRAARALRRTKKHRRRLSE